MTDTKTRLLGQNTSPLLTDLIHMVDDPAGTPVDEHILLAHLLQLPCAQIYTSAGSGSQTPGTGYTKLTQWDSNGYSFNLTADAANNKITIPSAYTGLYIVFASISFGVGATSSFDAFFRVYWNSVAQAQCTARVADTVGHATLAGLVNVTTASTDLEIYLRTSAASKDVDVQEAQFLAARIAADI